MGKKKARKSANGHGNGHNGNGDTHLQDTPAIKTSVGLAIDFLLAHGVKVTDNGIDLNKVQRTLAAQGKPKNGHEGEILGAAKKIGWQPPANG